MWRYDLRGRRHKRRCEKRTTRRYAVVKINEEIDFSSLLNLFRVKAKLAAEFQNVDSVSYTFRILSWSREDPIATGTLSAILDFSTDFFAYWRSIRKSIEL